MKQQMVDLTSSFHKKMTELTPILKTYDKRKSKNDGDKNDDQDKMIQQATAIMNQSNQSAHEIVQKVNRIAFKLEQRNLSISRLLNEILLTTKQSSILSKNLSNNIKSIAFNALENNQKFILHSIQKFELLNEQHNKTIEGNICKKLLSNIKQHETLQVLRKDKLISNYCNVKNMYKDMKHDINDELYLFQAYMDTCASSISNHVQQQLAISKKHGHVSNYNFDNNSTALSKSSSPLSSFMSSANIANIENSEKISFVNISHESYGKKYQSLKVGHENGQDIDKNDHVAIARMPTPVYVDSSVVLPANNEYDDTDSLSQEFIQNGRESVASQLFNVCIYLSCIPATYIFLLIVPLVQVFVLFIYSLIKIVLLIFKPIWINCKNNTNCWNKIKRA